jgi:hypothetical protein
VHVSNYDFMVSKQNANMTQYDSIKEAIDGLKGRGFSYDFNLDERRLCNPAKTARFAPEEFKIVEVYRFEGMTNPSESSVVYAIESAKYKLKGYLVNAYGIYSDAHSTDLASKMEIEHHEVS